MNETLKTINNRRSCRKYQDVKLSHDEINHILQAGLQAPSAMNRQKVIITAVTNKNIIDSLSKAIAKALGKEESYSCFYNAPCIVIVSAPKEYAAIYKDGSCVLENIFIAATSLQIGSCWINQLGNVIDHPEVRAIVNTCNIPVDHHVCGCASLGYAAETSVPKEKDVQRIQIID